MKKVRIAAVTYRHRSDSCVDRLHEPQADEGGRVESLGSRTQSLNRQQRHNREIVASQASTMPKGKTRPRQSAADALRARREAENGRTAAVTTPAPPVPEVAPMPAEVQHKIKTKGKAKVNGGDLQTPAQPAKSPKQNSTHPATGKLKSRTKDINAATSVAIERSKPGRSKRSDSDGTDELVTDDGRPKRKGDRSSREGALKTPAAKDSSRGTKRTGTYDLEESPEPAQSAEWNQDTGLSKKAPATKQRDSVASSRNWGQGGLGANPPRSTRGTARQRAAQPDRSRSFRRSRRERMKAGSNVEAHDQPASSAKANADVDSAPFSRQKQCVSVTSKSKASRGSVRTEYASKVSKLGEIANGEDVMMEEDIFRDDSEELPPVKTEAMNEGTPITDNKDCNNDSEQPELAKGGKGGTARAQRGRADPRSTMKDQRQNTPSVQGSSPPRLIVAGQIEKMRSKKPSFISFTKSGPQNQGTLSTGKARPPRRSGRPSEPPDDDLPQSRSSKQNKVRGQTSYSSTSTAPNEKSRQHHRPTSHKNVAEDVPHALSGFKKSIASPVLQNQKRQEAPLEPIPDDDEGYAHIDDFDTTVMMAEEDEVACDLGPKEAVQRSRSQIAMPPPLPPPPKAPRPAKMAKSSADLPKDVRSMDLDKRVSEDATTKKVSLATKRGYSGESHQDRASKRLRTSTQNMAEASQSAKAREDSNGSHMDQAKSVFSSQKTQPVLNPARQTSQNPGFRQRSHGSQKVDIQGSPIPAGMIINDKGTVLETFSQQNRLSSDGAGRGVAIAEENSSSKAISPVTERLEFAPPSHQTESMSSNKKRKPSGPEDESQGITKMDRAHHRQHLVNEGSGLSTDPFTSAEGHKRPRQGRSSSELFAQLKAQIQNETVNRLKQYPSTPQISDEAIASLRRKPSRQGVREGTTAKFPRQQPKHDPDITLVGRESYLGRSTRAISISSASSHASVTTAESPSSAHEALRVWRNALEPHQMNLFDGLVMVSHKLVRHLVDQETAEKDIAYDYRRHGLNIVEEMERRHARQYKDALKRLRSRRDRSGAKFISYSESLKGKVAEVQKRRRERKETMSAGGEWEQTLQKLLD